MSTGTSKRAGNRKPCPPENPQGEEVPATEIMQAWPGLPMDEHKLEAAIASGRADDLQDAILSAVSSMAAADMDSVDISQVGLVPAADVWLKSPLQASKCCLYALLADLLPYDHHQMRLPKGVVTDGRPSLCCEMLLSCSPNAGSPLHLKSLGLHGRHCNNMSTQRTIAPLTTVIATSGSTLLPRHRRQQLIPLVPDIGWLSVDVPALKLCCHQLAEMSHALL